MLEKWEVLTLLAVILGMLTPVFLAFFGTTIERWFRFMERRDNPGWDDILDHLTQHRFGWSMCYTCVQVGESRHSGIPLPREMARPEWADGYEAGYVDGHDNRPRMEP